MSNSWWLVLSSNGTGLTGCSGLTGFFVVLIAVGWRKRSLGAFVELVGRELTEEIIGAAYAVHNELGSGFLEKVYENAMAVELRSRKIAFRTQAPLEVKYRREPVGEYFADMIVEGAVIYELKALDIMPREAEIQLVNYLVATGIDIGLLINFGKSVTVRRKFRTTRKNPVNPENPVLLEHCDEGSLEKRAKRSSKAKFKNALSKISDPEPEEFDRL